MITRHTAQATPQLDTPAPRPSTRRLLTVAALAGPLFYASSLVQALTREGFDIRVHPLSQLATGGPGWIQQLSFVLAGVGVLALAVAHRRIITRGAGSRLAPILIGVFGAGFAIAGLFPMDPQNGFPVGAPEGVVEMSWHSIVHSSAAAVSFTALAAACITLHIRSIRHRASAGSDRQRGRRPRPAAADVAHRVEHPDRPHRADRLLVGHRHRAASPPREHRQRLTWK